MRKISSKYLYLIFNKRVSLRGDTRFIVNYTNIMLIIHGWKRKLKKVKVASFTPLK